MSSAADGALVMLLVEDNRADVVFFQEALEETQVPATLHVVRDGAEAMRFVLRQQPFADAPRPHVIVLDLNLPVKNGQEVMRELVSVPALNTIPVAILTTSTSEAYVCEMCARGRCLYFAKTDDFRRLQDIVRQIAAHASAAVGGV